MKHFLLLSVAFYCFTTTVLPQRNNEAFIDSLKTLLQNATTDTGKVRLLADIMYAHVYYNPEMGLSYKQQGLDLAEKTKWPAGKAMILDKTGRLLWRMGRFNQALYHHFAAFSLFNQLGLKYKNYVLVEIGQDYLDGGDYQQAEYYLLRAVKQSTSVNDKNTLSDAYVVLTYLYSQQGNTGEMMKMSERQIKVEIEMGDTRNVLLSAMNMASRMSSIGNITEELMYLEKAEVAAKANNDFVSSIHLHSMMANCYTVMGNFPLARKYMNQALEYALKQNDPQLLASIYTDRAGMLESFNDYPGAIDYYKKAEKKSRQTADKESLAVIYYRLGSVYTITKQYALAAQFFDSSKTLYQKLNTKLLAMGDYFAGRERLDSVTGNWHSAYENYRKYIEIRDSAFNKENLRKMVTFQLQYESDKKEAAMKAEQEKKDVQAREEIRRQRNIRNSAFAVLALMLVFFAVVFYQRNKIAKEKKRSDQLVTDKELLLREIHHRVKNNLEIVSSLLALQSAQIDDENTKEAMLEGQNRVQSIGIVHQKLYQGDNLGAVEMKDYFINLSESILDSFGADNRVQIDCVMDKLNMDIDTAVPLGLIVNELLTNTLKYAFPDSRHGKVEIALQQHSNGILRLRVSDNGVGKSGITQGTGFGSQLVNLLTRQLNGSMTENNIDGTSVLFEFKTGKAV